MPSLWSKSATTVAACTTTQPCEKDSRGLITQTAMLELDLPETPELDHPKEAGSIPGPILTIALGPTAEAGRAAPPSRGRYSHCSTSGSPLTEQSYQSPLDLTEETDAAQYPTANTA